LTTRTLSASKMPNRNKFVGAPGSDVKNPECRRVVENVGIMYPYALRSSDL